MSSARQPDRAGRDREIGTEGHRFPRTGQCPPAQPGGKRHDQRRDRRQQCHQRQTGKANARADPRHELDIAEPQPSRPRSIR